MEPFRVARLDELDRISVAGVTWHPVRRRLRTRAFGINAYSADAGEQLIEPHDETGPGAGAHEELYVVISGRATFTVAGEDVDAPAGTFVFVPDLAARREAVAVENGTSALVVGGPPAQDVPVSPWEFYFAAEPAREARDWDRALEIVAEGLERYPEHPVIHYEVGCLHALSGRREQAFEHLRIAFEARPSLREHAAKDADLDGIRDDPAFPGAST